MLHRAGLTEEQQAVILARAQGQLEREKISVAMRSCYPDLVCKSSKAFPAHLVEEPVDESTGPAEEAVPEIDFDDVELLLAEHQLGAGNPELSAESFLETDVAEVLAVSWKEKRAELSRLQKARKFTAAKDLKRSFRIEVEELKRKTKCHRCGKQGH